MGAGSKSDPSRIQQSDISQTTYDPLSRAVRRRLKIHPVHPVAYGIPVVYSTEVPSSHYNSSSGSGGSTSKGEDGDEEENDGKKGGKKLGKKSNGIPGLLPLPESEFQKGPVKELGPFDDFRVRILPVLGPLPAIFGLSIATYILCEIAGKGVQLAGFDGLYGGGEKDVGGENEDEEGGKTRREEGLEALGVKGRKKLYEKMIKDLAARETKFYKLGQQQ